MKAIKRTPVFIVIIALTLLTTIHLRAGGVVNINWFSGVASVAGISISPPSSPNNHDVVGPSPNNIYIAQKDYVGIGPVDLVFDTLDTGGITEYLVTEGVFNHTGVNWGSYHIELGFGHGTSFVPSAPGDGLDFDAPNFNSPFFFDPSPGFFPMATVTEDNILAFGGVMPDLSYAGNFLFTVDVPDGITSFTIRQSPIGVPEPSTCALLALGAVALAIMKRRTQLP
jgi:hypothetical protein